MDPITGKPWTPGSNPLITVNQRVWRLLPEHERTRWGSWEASHPLRAHHRDLSKLLLLSPDIENAIEGAKTEIGLAEEEEEKISFRRHSVYCCESGWTFGVNRDMIHCMVSHQRKAVHPFPYFDRCLSIAD